MRARHISALIVFAATGCATAPPQPAVQIPPAATQSPGHQRVLPVPVEPPEEFRQAVQNGTRSATGRPGAAYWQNRATYQITATLHPDDNRLDGSVEISFRNSSPDTLYNLHVDLTQNIHAPGAIRFEEAEVTGGVELRRVAVNRQQLTTAGEGARYAVFGTRMVLLPPQPVAPGQTVSIGIDWALPIPQAGAGERMGYGEDLFFLAYWYPQMAVYDDVIGWHPDPFVATTEFYHGFGRYELTIDAPAGWVVMATGELVNPDETLALGVLQRYRAAAQSDTVVRILRAPDFASATRTGTRGRLQWRFVADSVRDVAFSATRRSNWDGMRTPVGDRNGDGTTDYTMINSFWRDSAPLWSEVARYSAHSITFLSEFMALPYPWPHMTAVEGAEIIGGGMEFPMMTLMGDYNQRGDSALYYVTAHELAHMWFPMIVSSDERRYTWMDEGKATFNENMARMDFFPGRNHHLDDMATYSQVAGTDQEGEMMRRSAYHYDAGAYVVASYMKPATVLGALRGVLGEDVFMQAYREYAQRWRYRHPYPWDMWNTFEDVSGRDLEWFWRSWYYETWTLDHAIASVTQTGGTTTIFVADLGRVPMPVHLTITYPDGRTERHDVPVDHWLAGNTDATVTVTGADIVRVEIDAARQFPDVNRQNNVWRR
ncbi:M1 family metallopeptidase [soil metagenome]